MKTTHLLMTIILFLLWNSVIAQSFTNPIYQQADPFITYYDGYYYATGTSGSNVVLKKSETLEGLKAAKATVVFGPAFGGPCCSYWAPEIYRIDGAWYIYYTANDSGDLAQRTYVIENTADDPTTGDWTDRGRIYDPNADYFSLDGTVLTTNGSNYFLWSGIANASDGDKPQRIYIAKMSNPWTLESGRVLLKSPEFDWEQNGAVNEGPEILKGNGKIFLVYSANACWTPDYLLGMLSIDEGSDPLNADAWYTYPDPVFSTKASVDAYGPGHNCFFKSPDGTEDWMAYHALTLSSGACDNNRTPRAQKVLWNADGTPNFGTPLRTGIRVGAPSGEPELPTASPLENGTYKIIARCSDKPLTVEDNSPDLGANVFQSADVDEEGQKWNIQATTEGYYIITAVKGGLTLDVVDGSTENAANIRMWSSNAANCQQWSITDIGDGYYKITNRKSDKVMDIQFGGTDDELNLQQYDYLEGENQQFSFELVSKNVTPPSGYTSWATYNVGGQNIRHKDGIGLIAYNINPVNDAYWEMVPGLAGRGVSFKANNITNAYLRHKDGEIVLNVDDGTDLFDQDATFIVRRGLADQSKYSFESYNFSDEYIRHQNSTLYRSAISTNLEKNDATFVDFGTHDFELTIEAEEFSTMSGIETETTTDTREGLNVGYIETGDWMAYSDITIYESGYYNLQYRVASESTGGQLSLDIDAGSTILGYVDVPVTGGWQTWQTVSHTVYIDAGTYSFGIYAQSGGWNFNWWSITPSTSSGSRTSATESALTEVSTNSIYPNPSKDYIHINFADKSGDVTLLDASGTVLKKATLNNHESLDVSTLPKGMYIIKIRSGNTQSAHRFIKN